MGVILETLHKIAAHPWVYDRIQDAAGQAESLRRIQKHVRVSPPEKIIDVGGGTGATRNVWPPGCRYVCLDIEMPKLRGFLAKNPDGSALLADATRMPVATGCADLVVCMAVVHHLSDEMLTQVMDEAVRVLRVGGRLVLLDPVLNRSRWAGLVLWKLDRGSNPRTAEQLREILEARFRVRYWEKYSVYHEYVLGVGERV